MVRLTIDEIFTLYEALLTSYRFYTDKDEQAKAERMTQLMEMFHFVKSARDDPRKRRQNQGNTQAKAGQAKKQGRREPGWRKRGGISRAPERLTALFPTQWFNQGPPYKHRANREWLQSGLI